MPECICSAAREVPHRNCPVHGRDAAREPHYSTEFDENEDGWYEPTCSCGQKMGAYPTAEDACDALMQHAYEQGILDERNYRV